MKSALIFTLAAVLPGLAASATNGAGQGLSASPRHQEWADVKHGNRSVHSFVVYPQTSRKATAVVVIHENRGLTDWVRSIADQLAEAGYLAIAPDLLSGMAPGGGNTSNFPNEDAAMQAIYRLDPGQVTEDLTAVADYVVKLPAANGKLVVAGFCWGGGQSFRFATNRKALNAAFVFYGTAPEDRAALERIASPVYGFYGGNDARVDATIPATEAAMKQAGKKYEPVTYQGAGHAFMRLGEEPNGTEENKKARDQAWVRWKALLKQL